MAGKTNFLEGAVFDYFLLTAAAPTRPSSLTIALYTTAPDPELGTGGVEVSGGAYARQTITFTKSGTTQAANTSDVLFPVATASWGTVAAFAIIDNNANLLYTGNFTASKTIATDDQLKIAAGQLIITED
jgi:hypothetical protein